LRDTPNGEPISIDGLSITDVVDASYTIGDISISEADANGIVQMTIPYRIDFTTTLTMDMSKFVGQFNWGWQCQSISLFNYYTGIVIPSKTLTTNTGKPTNIFENAIDITYKDVTSPVSCMVSVTQNINQLGWVPMGGNTSEQQMVVSMDAVCTIYMPKEYDGLCLSLCLPGWTEYKKPKEEFSEIATLLEKMEDGKDISDYALIRVSDLM
jgi:hypothetical protein